MFLATSPPSTGTRPARPALRRLTVREFGPVGGYEHDPLLERYLADMSGLYGVAYRADRYAAGRRNPYTSMAQTLLDELSPLPGEPRVILLAHSTPDADPRRVTACHLADIAPGDPLAFAVSDQGVVAAFSALRMLGVYGRYASGRIVSGHDPVARHEPGDHPADPVPPTGSAGSGATAVLMVLDQSTLPYDTDVPAALLADRDVGVAVLFDLPADEGAGPATAARWLWQRTGVSADLLAHQLADLLTGALAEHDDVRTLVLGTDLAGVRPAVPDTVTVHRAGPGLPCTGLWAQLAACAPPSGTVLLADYDANLGYLCLAALPVDADRPDPESVTEDWQ